MKKILFLLFWVLGAGWASAQPDTGWDQAKLMAQRYVSNDNIQGTPFVYDQWIDGTVYLTSGDSISGIPLKFDAERGELISYNKIYYALVTIEKSAVSAFRFHLAGEVYYFEKRWFGGLEKGDRFFRVFGKGEVDLLSLYRIERVNTSLYRDESGIMRNQEFASTVRYFLKNDRSDFFPTNLKRKSLYRRIGKDDRREARQVIRQNNITFGLAHEYARALSLLETAGIKLHL